MTSSCPYCRQPIDPPPKRSRKCPHCRAPIVVRRGNLFTEAGAEKFDEAAEADRAKKHAKIRAERYKEFRGYSRRNLKQAKESGVVIAFEFLVSDNDCDVCQKVKGKRIPISGCTLDMLPPFKDCENEDGCRATWVDVLDPKYSGKPDSSVSLRSAGQTSSGCLGIAVLAIVAVFLFIQGVSGFHQQ